MDTSGHGNRELQGLPEDLIRLFSKRTSQIDAELGRLATDRRERTPRLVKWTVQATRKPKQHEPRTPCTTAGGLRQPRAAPTRTVWSGGDRPGT